MAPPVTRRHLAWTVLPSCSSSCPLLEAAAIIAVGRAIRRWPLYLLLAESASWPAGPARGTCTWLSLQEVALNATGRMPSCQFGLRRAGPRRRGAAGGAWFITDIVGFLPRAAVHPPAGPPDARGRACCSPGCWPVVRLGMLLPVTCWPGGFNRRRSCVRRRHRGRDPL